MTVLTVPRPLTSLRSASRRSGIHCRVSGVWDSFVSTASAHNVIPSGFGFRYKKGHLQRQKKAACGGLRGWIPIVPYRFGTISALAQILNSIWRKHRNLLSLETIKVVHMTLYRSPSHGQG